ncbi:NAD(P)-dependent alcohol dehydrogenase [Blastococcus sp. CT_GayMR16]|nr:NAD(P)-dependent alcohol dehydrogenase [Blastococcus sp. CT_GayMR16]
MRAVVQDVYGDTSDVMRLEQIARPEPGPGQVLVRVAAAGVDRGVWHLMAGKPYAARLAFGLRTPRHPVRGREFAGRVEAVGSGVTTVRPGDEIYGMGEGTFAEYVLASESKVAPRPANLSAVQAAALSISGVTALQAVRDHGRVTAGQQVLVIGASGGVGSFAVQIAKASGAEVTGVSSAAKADLVRALGADSVVDYSVGDGLEVGERRFDVVLDIGGDRPLRQLRRVLTPHGRLVIVGGEGGGRLLGIGRQLRAAALSPFVGQTLGFFVASEKAADLVLLTGLVESGQVTPAVDRTFPLAEAAAAVTYMTGGHARGKVVVEVSR